MKPGEKVDPRDVEIARLRRELSKYADGCPKCLERKRYMKRYKARRKAERQAAENAS